MSLSTFVIFVFKLFIEITKSVVKFGETCYSMFVSAHVEAHCQCVFQWLGAVCLTGWDFGWTVGYFHIHRHYGSRSVCCRKVHIVHLKNIRNNSDWALYVTVCEFSEYSLVINQLILLDSMSVWIYWSHRMYTVPKKPNCSFWSNSNVW